MQPPASTHHLKTFRDHLFGVVFLYDNFFPFAAINTFSMPSNVMARCSSHSYELGRPYVLAWKSSDGLSQWLIYAVDGYTAARAKMAPSLNANLVSSLALLPSAPS